MNPALFHYAVTSPQRAGASAAALHFPLYGVILENAEHSVRQAVSQILAEIEGLPQQHLQIPACFIPAESMGKIKVVDLANQRFPIQE